MFIAQRLVRPSKQLKQIIQIEHNIVKNPNWLEANQLAIYKRGRGFELGATVKKFQVVVSVGFEPGTAGLRVRRADHSATLLVLTPCARSCTVAVFGIRLTFIVNAGFLRRMKQMTAVCFQLFR